MEKISKSKIERRLKEKTNPQLIEAIIKLKRTNPEIAKKLAMPVKKQAEINLDRINKIQGDALVPGKVLSSGNLDRKMKIVAWKFSEKALEKIKSAGSEAVLIADEIKKNPELKNLKII